MANMAQRDAERYVRQLLGDGRALKGMRHVIGGDPVTAMEGVITRVVEAINLRPDPAKAADDLIVVRPKEPMPEERPEIAITHEVRTEPIPPEVEAAARAHFTPERCDDVVRDAVRRVGSAARASLADESADLALCPKCGGRKGGPALDARCLWLLHDNSAEAGE